MRLRKHLWVWVWQDLKCFLGGWERARPFPASLPRAWVLLLTSPPYFCWSCPSHLTPQTPHYLRVQKHKQWRNRGTHPGTQHLAQPGTSPSFHVVFPLAVWSGDSVAKGQRDAGACSAWLGRMECHPFPRQAPLNVGTCPTGGLVRDSGCLSPCPVCRRLWTKQAPGDSPPFPGLVTHQPPPATGLASQGCQSGEVAPAAEPGCHGNEESPFPQLRRWRRGGLSPGGTAGSPASLAPHPVVPQGGGISKLRCGEWGLMIW